MAKESEIVIRDRASQAIERIMNTMGRLIDQSERLDQSVIETSDNLEKLSTDSVAKLPPVIEQSIDKQDQFNDEIEQSVNLMSNLKRIAAGVIIGKFLKDAVSLGIQQSDIYATNRARIDLMNDGLQSTHEIQEMIFRSAENARSEYQAMTDMVGKLGLLAGDAFDSTAETVLFAELIQKQFAIAGTSASEAAGATTQLVQALASGVLRGDELNSIFEQAPTIIQSIADYLDVPIGQIREMASEGELTADIVKNAMFASIDDINAKFEAMPKTWEAVWTSFKNHAQRAFTPVFEMFSRLANSKEVEAMVDGVIGAMYTLASVTTRVMQLLGSLGNFVYEHWSIIAPLIYSVVGAMGTYLVVLGAYTTVRATANAVTAIANTLATIQAARQTMVAGATFMATAAQHGFNAALLASPITWVVLGLVALVALLYAGVAAWNHFTNSAVSATGIILGAVYWLLAGVVNVVVGIANILIVFAQLIVNAFQIAVMTVAYILMGLATIALGIFDVIVQIVLRAAEIFITIWNFAVFTVQLVFYGLVVAVLAVFDAIINAVYWVVEIFVNAWNNGVYAVQMAFYKMGEGIASTMNAVAQGVVGVVNAALGMISDLVNTGINGLNKMINAANKIPGVNISSIGEVDFRIDTSSMPAISFDTEMPTMPERFSMERSTLASDFMANNAMPTMAETPNLGDGTSLASDFMGWIGDNMAPVDLAKFETFDWTSMSDAFNNGYQTGENIADRLKNMFKQGEEQNENIGDMSDLLEELLNAVPDDPGGGGGSGGGGGRNPTGGRLDSIGEIEDEIDINDEVIKYMKDIANLKYQQNFVTLTPEIVNNNQFVDETDKEDAIKKFNQDVAEALYSAVDGLYD